MNDLKDLLRLADTAAAAAGEALLANRVQWGVIEDVQGREVKIGGDKHAEEIVLTAIQRDSDYPIISEEAGWARSLQRGDRFVWAIDPLYGSVNYLRGNPHCAVSIALLDDGKPILGVVDCFVTRERFTGAIGHGAWLNGAPMRVSAIENPASGILQTGVPSRASDASMKAFEERLRAWQKVRMIGSENPCFEVIKALISRSRVFQLRNLNQAETGILIDRALTDKERGYGNKNINLHDDARTHLIEVASGDARNALNAIELAVESTSPDVDGVIQITLDVALRIYSAPRCSLRQRRRCALRYDQRLHQIRARK